MPGRRRSAFRPGRGSRCRSRCAAHLERPGVRHPGRRRGGPRRGLIRLGYLAGGRAARGVWFRPVRPGRPRRPCHRLSLGLGFRLGLGRLGLGALGLSRLGLGALGEPGGPWRAFLHRHLVVFGRRDEQRGGRRRGHGVTAGGGAAFWRAASGRATAARPGPTHCGRASSSASTTASWGSRMAERALAGAFFTLFGRALGGWLCHTRAVTRISSFSANGAIRHQVRGSATYRSCELTSSGSRLLSMTGLGCQPGEHSRRKYVKPYQVMVERQTDSNEEDHVGDRDPGEDSDPGDRQGCWQPKIVKLVKSFSIRQIFV